MFKYVIKWLKKYHIKSKSKIRKTEERLKKTRWWSNIEVYFVHKQMLHRWYNWKWMQSEENKK